MFAELSLRFFPSGLLSGVNARAVVYTGMCSQYYCLASLLTLACVLSIVFILSVMFFIWTLCWRESVEKYGVRYTKLSRFSLTSLTVSCI
jgi:uncharacterized membrane protein